MPRKRSTGRAAKHREAMQQAEPESFNHLLGSGRRTETKLGNDWVVQSVPAVRASKTYVCPGCPNPVNVGMAHVGG